MSCFKPNGVVITRSEFLTEFIKNFVLLLSGSFFLFCSFPLLRDFADEWSNQNSDGVREQLLDSQVNPVDSSSSPNGKRITGVWERTVTALDDSTPTPDERIKLFVD